MSSSRCINIRTMPPCDWLANRHFSHFIYWFIVRSGISIQNIDQSLKISIHDFIYSINKSASRKWPLASQSQRGIFRMFTSSWHLTSDIMINEIVHSTSPTFSNLAEFRQSFFLPSVFCPKQMVKCWNPKVRIKLLALYTWHSTEIRGPVGQNDKSNDIWRHIVGKMYNIRTMPCCDRVGNRHFGHFDLLIYCEILYSLLSIHRPLP